MRRKLFFVLVLAACGTEAPAPSVSRAWPAMGSMMSAAAWGADTTALSRALAAVRDTIESMDAEVRSGGGRRITALDSLRQEIRARTGVRVPRDSLAVGYALARARLALAGTVDSALLDLNGQILWVSGSPRETHRAVGIPDPDNSLRMLGLVTLLGGSIRTVSQRNAPPDAVRSMTVLAGDAFAANSWAHVFFRLSCDSALALAPRLERIGVVCVDASGVRWTPDLEQRVVLPTAPARQPAPGP